LLPERVLTAGDRRQHLHRCFHSLRCQYTVDYRLIRVTD
jgi:hypothetical protein